MDTEIAMINNVITMKDPSGPEKLTGIGERLKLAREAMHLSEKEAAARLYLNTKIISIMESEKFAEGPPATFMRGYLHSYARLLSLPEDEIVLALKELEVSLPPNRDVTNQVLHTAINPNDKYVRWITLFIIFTLVLLVSIWWSSHSKYAISDVPTKAPAHVEPAASIAAPVAATPVKTVVQTPDNSPLNAAKPTAAAPATPPLVPPASIAKPDKAKTATHKSGKRSKKASKKSRNIVLSLPEPE